MFIMYPITNYLEKLMSLIIFFQNDIFQVDMKKSFFIVLRNA